MRVIAFALACFLITISGSVSGAWAIVIWEGNINQDWNEPFNWSSSTVPVLADDVFIDLGFTVNITATPSPINSITCHGTLNVSGAVLNIAAVSEIATLNLSGNASLQGTGNLSITSVFDWNSGAVNLTDGAVLDIASGATANVGNGDFHSQLISGTVNNRGTVTCPGPYGVQLDGAAEFHNYGDFLIDEDDLGQLLVAGPETSRFVNESGALVQKGADSGTTEFEIPFYNLAGTVEVLTGTLTFRGPFVPTVESDGGAWQGAGGSTLYFRYVYGSPTFTFDEDSSIACDNMYLLRGTHTFGMTNPGGFVVTTLTMNQCRADFNTAGSAEIQNLDLISDAWLQGTGSLKITNHFNWGYGHVNLTGTAYLELVDGATANLGIDEHWPSMLRGGRVDNQGTVILADLHGLEIYSPAVFDNYGRFTIEDDQGISGTPAGSFNLIPGGVLEKVGGVGTSTISIPVNNQGTIAAKVSTLRINQLSNYSANTLAGGSYDITDILVVDGADIHTNEAEIVLNGPGSSFQDPSGNPALRNLSTNATSGVLELVDGAAVSSSAGVTNDGSLRLNGASTLGCGGNFTQSSSGDLKLGLSSASPVAGFVQATGAGSFDGDLEIVLDPGYAASIDDSYVLASYTGIGGSSFVTESYPMPALDWELSFNLDQLLLNTRAYSLTAYLGATGELVGIDVESEITHIQPSTPGPMASSVRMASSPAGDLLYALLNPGPTAELARYDPLTGEIVTTMALTTGPLTSVSTIAIGPYAGMVWAVAHTVGGNDVLTLIRPVLRWLLKPRPLTFSTSSGGEAVELMSFSPAGDLIGAQNIGGGTLRLWSISTSTGIATLLGEIPGIGDGFDGMSFLGEALWVNNSTTGTAVELDPVGVGILRTVILDRTGVSGLARSQIHPITTELVVRAVLGGGILEIHSTPDFSTRPDLLRYELYRDVSMIGLDLGTPVFIDSATNFPIEDATTVDYTAYLYRVDVIVDDGLGGEILAEQLYTTSAFSSPTLVINEFGPSGPGSPAKPSPGGVKSTGVGKLGELVEIQNLSDTAVDITGYRLSNGTAEELLTGSIPGNGFFVHTLAAIDLNDAGGTLALLPADADYTFDEIGWGTEGPAPAVPPGFSISRVPGTTSDDPPEESFSLSPPTYGFTNDVVEPQLGASIVFNEVGYTGTAGEDYVELFNPLGGTVALNGFALSDGINWVDTLDVQVTLNTGSLVAAEPGGEVPFTRDLVQSELYLYRIQEDGRLQLVDQLGWGAGVADPPPPGPVAPELALMRMPDGVAQYLGDNGANWYDCGGGAGLGYGMPSPGLPNLPPGLTVLIVDAGGGGDYSDLASAVAAATPGTALLIQPGIYQGPITLPAGVSLLGNAPDASQVQVEGDPLGLQPTVAVNGNDASSQISNLTLRHGSARALELIDSYIRVSTVRFEDHQGTIPGAAVLVQNGAPQFEGCSFLNNTTSAEGGAVYVIDGRPSFMHSLFVNNTADDGGGAIFVAAGGLDAEGCVFDRNACGSGGGTVQIVGGDAGMYYDAITNTSGGGGVIVHAPGSAEMACSLLWNNAEGSGPPSPEFVQIDVVEADPEYCAPGSLNYAYAEGSAADALAQSCGAIIGVAGPPCGETVVDTPSPRTSSLAGITQVFPNPFNPQTSIQFTVDRPGIVSLGVYDLRGRLVDRLVDDVVMDPGDYIVRWGAEDRHGRKIASGVYFVQLSLDGEARGPARKLALLK